MTKNSLFQRAQLAVLLLCVASLAQRAHAQTFIFTNIWSISTTNGRAYVSSAAGNERGITVNPATTNVLLVSRATTPPTVVVLNGNDGSEIRTLNVSGVTGGFFALNKIQVAEDGVVWAANLTLNGTTANYKIYRWNNEDDTEPPIVAYDGDPGVGTAFRWGDSFAVRGFGPDTQIIASGSANTRVAFFTTTDGINLNLTTLTPSVATAVYGKGLAFYTNATFVTKHSPDTLLRFFSYDLGTGTASLLGTAPLDNIMVGLQVDANRDLLVGTLSDNTATAAGHRVRIYDFANPAQPLLLNSFDMPGPYIVDGNRAGEADIANDLIVGVSAQNGVVAIRVGVTNLVLPPSIVSQPQSQTALQGGYVTFSVSATGTQPLRYQWRFNGTTDLVGQTNSTLTLTNLSSADAGDYNVVVSNDGGSTNSAAATLTVEPAILSSKMAPLWRLRPGDRPYLTSDNTQRGLAYNPANGRLLVVTRAPSASIRVLNAADGSDLHSLNMTGVGGHLGETFPINLAGVTDDGVVYACNLGNTTTGQGFTIYRWTDDEPTTVPSIVFGPTQPGQLTGNRIGDVMDVRGEDLTITTQILCPSREDNRVVVFNLTLDGLLNATVLTVADPPAGTRGFAGLGAAFGSGDTFWAKAASFPVSHVSFDLINVSAAVTATYFPSTTSTFSNTTVIDFDAANDFLAAIAFNETPDNLQLFDMGHRDTVGPVLIDQDFFPADNPNDNGTGAIAFDPAGGRVFALESNNGIIALNIVARLKQSRSGNDITLSWTGPSVLQSAPTVNGTYSDVMGATSGYTETMSGNRFFRLRR